MNNVTRRVSMDQRTASLLPTVPIDVVTIAQAFHWFDDHTALHELIMSRDQAGWWACFGIVMPINLHEVSRVAVTSSSSASTNGKSMNACRRRYVLLISYL